eukprot:SAG31_NODE_12856_length_911_cov_1.136700_1_plen_80_part_00
MLDRFSTTGLTDCSSAQLIDIHFVHFQMPFHQDIVSHFATPEIGATGVPDESGDIVETAGVSAARSDANGQKQVRALIV